MIANETPEEREKRLAKSRARYQQNKEKRRKYHREYNKRRRANETPEEREKRLAKQREYHKRMREKSNSDE